MNQYQVPFLAKFALLWLVMGVLPLASKPALAEATDAMMGNMTGNVEKSPKIADQQQILPEVSKTTQSSQSSSNIAPNVAPQPTSTDKLSELVPLTNNSSSEADSLGEVTSVSQLRDVQPNDWAYEALRNLVERYGCIAGYPDGTFRGNRAMTRYEFAAGLNACLKQVEKLISASTADFANKQDLATLQKLTEEFKTELASLGTRVDKLEGRVGFLENHQFSTTTKLSGEAIMAVVGAIGGTPTTGKDANTMMVDRVRLNLQTSFTGKDLLITGLQAYNFGGSLSGAGSVQNTLFPGQSLLANGMSKLSFEPEFPGSLGPAGNNSINLYKLLYIFPVAKKLTMFVGTAAESSDAFPAITPFANEGQEAISRFAGYNPVVRVSGGTTGTGLAAPVGFIWSISDKMDLRAFYGSVTSNLPSEGASPLGSGFFNGSYVAAAQLTVKPTKNLDFALNYAHSYHKINILGTGLSSADTDALGLTLAGLGTPVNVDSVGGTVNWKFSPKVSLSSYGAAFFVNDTSTTVNASSTLTSWMVGLHFSDAFKKGNTAGLIFGQPIFRTSVDGSGNIATPAVSRTTPYHLEGYYRFQVSDNISITPGAIVLFNPEGDNNNRTTALGVIRTTFSF